MAKTIRSLEDLQDERKRLENQLISKEEAIAGRIARLRDPEFYLPQTSITPDKQQKAEKIIMTVTIAYRVYKIIRKIRNGRK